MNTKRKTKRFTAALLTLAMLLSLVQVSVFAEASGAAAKICVSFSDRELILPRVEVMVSAGLAREYGYEVDSQSSPTVLDALVAVHSQLLSEDFTAETAKNYLEINGSGFLTRVLADSRPFGFMVNGRTPNDGVYNEAYGQYNAYTADRAPLSAGDLVEFYFYQDRQLYTDYYSWFDRQSAALQPGAELTLTLNGYASLFGASKEEAIAAGSEPVAGAEITSGTDPGKLSPTGKLTGGEGQVTLSFDSPGTYYISAVGDEELPLIAPWCVVTVRDEKEERIQALLENISAGYFDATEDWKVLDMTAYGQKDKLSQLPAYRLAAVEAAQSSSNLTDWARISIALTAVGDDVTKLRSQSGETLNLIQRISEAEEEGFSFVTSYIFSLLAYDSGNYTVSSGMTREKLIRGLLGSRTADGIWGYSFGGNEYLDVDSTGMALSALAPYYLAGSATAAGLSADQYQEVQTAVDEILAKLSELQGRDGSWGNSSTNAMVLIGLAALGVSPDTDARFIKENGSALDGLLLYARADQTGFGLSGNTEINALSTEQAFRALAAYQGLVKSGKAFNVYLLKEDTNSGKPGHKTVNVSFTLMGDRVHGSKPHSGAYPIWISKTETGMDENSTVFDVIVKLLTENKYTYIGADQGYISSITTPDGVTLEEKDNGKNSGWMYQVNGKNLETGIKDYVLKEGDQVSLYYTDDYTKAYDPDGPKKSGGSSGSGGGGGNFLPVAGTTYSPSPGPETEAGESGSAFSDVPSGHWAYLYITQLTEKGIINGYDDHTYQPDAPITRAEFAALLARCSSEEPSETESGFTDVPQEEWYAAPVAWSVRAGIVTGVGDGRFEPEELISRQDLAVMLKRYLDYKQKSLPELQSADTFTDEEQIADYAAEAVAAMQRAGILNGDETGAFEPNRSATRAETAKILSIALFQ